MVYRRIGFPFSFRQLFAFLTKVVGVVSKRRLTHQWQKSLDTTKKVSSSSQKGNRASITFSVRPREGLPMTKGMSIKSSRLSAYQPSSLFPSTATKQDHIRREMGAGK